MIPIAFEHQYSEPIGKVEFSDDKAIFMIMDGMKMQPSVLHPSYKVLKTDEDGNVLQAELIGLSVPLMDMSKISIGLIDD